MYSELIKIVPSNCIKFNEPMKNHTTFGIGGPVDVLIEPDDTNLIINILHWIRENQVPLFIFGQGSNLLVKDNGIRGIAIKLGHKFNKIEVYNDEIKAEAGAMLSSIAEQALLHGLRNFEFAEGIPGSLGGAVVMNAGAYGGEMKNVLKSVVAVNHEGNLKEFTLNEMELAYRRSIFQTNGYYVLEATLSLQKGNQAEIKAKMQELSTSRTEKQPIDKPSAGSTFKRPPGHYVGPMIEELGLKGFTMGGAQVSTKHAGFIINTGSATAQDVLNLISYIQEKVDGKFGVRLEPELRIVGE